MAIPAGTRFRGTSPDVETENRGSNLSNSKRNTYTIEEIQAGGGGGPGNIGGGGTVNTIPVWTPDGTTLGDSPITNTSTGIDVTGTQSSFNGQVTIPTVPLQASDAAAKQYVDSLTSDTSSKLKLVTGTLFATWTGAFKPYFNFTNGNTVIVPYDRIVVNADIYGNSPFTYNNTSNLDSSFQIAASGVYEVSINAHFYDQFGDIDVYGGLYNNTTNALVIGLLDQKDVTGNNDSNWYGSTIVELGALTNYDIRLTFAGGSGQNPFPSDTGLILNSLAIKRLT